MLMRKWRVLMGTLGILVLAGTVAAVPADDPKHPIPPPGIPTAVVEIPNPTPAVWQDLKGTAGVPVKVKTKDDKSARWVLVDDVGTFLDVASDGKSATFTAQTKGAYKVLVWGETGDPGRIRYVIDGGIIPNPPDPPNPPPDPPIPPVPHGSVKSFVVVENTLKPGTFRGDILGSDKVAAFYKNRGLTHRLIDRNVDPSTLDAFGQTYLQAAKQTSFDHVLFTFDGPIPTGKLLAGMDCPKTPEAFVTALGGNDAKRSMGYIPSKKLRLAWKEFGDTPGVPMIDRTSWKEVSYKWALPAVHDQDGRGQCASSSACTLLESCRIMSGMPYVYFSAGDLYSRVNGGRDQGSMLEDNMEELMTNGVCEASLVPYIWDGRTHNDAAVKANRAKYKVVEVYLCRNFDAMASALMQGFLIQEGLMWYDNYDPDGSGWLPPGRGSPGGHALMGYGLAKNPTTGKWGIRTRNSWSSQWGVAGDCIIPETAFGSDIGGFWAVRAVSQTSEIRRPRSPFGLSPEYALAP